MTLKPTANRLPPELIEGILESNAAPVIVTDDDGLIVYANKGAENLFGYAKSELLGRPVELLVPARFRGHHADLRREYQQKPRARPAMAGLELYGCRSDGTTFRAEISLSPVKTEKGLFVATVLSETPEDDRSEEYFRSLLENAPDAMVIADAEGRISLVNAQAERMFGYSRMELLGKRIEMLLPARLRERHVAHRASFAKQPEVRPMGRGFELRARRKDGSEFPVEISLSPMRQGSDEFVWSVIRDVTERKKMELDIIEARRDAERANKANSAFLAAASHDLRQPVQALHLLTGALRRTVTDARAIEMIDSQQHSLTAMTNLLNSLLDISRLDAGKVTPEIEDFPMQRLIDRLSAEFGRQAQHKGLEFRSSGCPEVIRSDPNMLAEIIQNLVSNAIRYTESGSVTLQCRRNNGNCSLSVVDTGIGIEDDQLDAIFREFHQVKKRSSANEGFGLGLAIVRRMADLLDHRVTVSSEAGAGSTFTVTVPVVDSAGTATDDAGGHLHIADTPDGGLILLIEDDAAVANAWSMLLEAEGFTIEQAASATEAMEIVRRLDVAPALIVSDFHLLDGSTGVEAVAAIREHCGGSIPAFVVSGDTSKVVKDARLLDNCTLMNKPVDTNRLLAAAATAIRTGQVPAD